MTYADSLNERFWAYQQCRFPDWRSLRDDRVVEATRRPVFRPAEAWRNVILDPAPSAAAMNRYVLGLIEPAGRHKWFGSMNSSQALAQSVFGNLACRDMLSHLAGLIADEGTPLFGKASLSKANFKMEHEIRHLNEPRPTGLDGYFGGDYRVAVECKFTEQEVGSCSRPRLAKTASNYADEHCNGSYALQRGRATKCSLTKIGVAYWRHVPDLFAWPSDSDYPLCPLKENYQLVRNVLAVGVSPNQTVSLEDGHVVVIYDKRNPAFEDGGSGKGIAAYNETRRALRNQDMLRKCSWQRLTEYLRIQQVLPWLTEELGLKYGF